MRSVFKLYLACSTEGQFTDVTNLQLYILGYAWFRIGVTVGQLEEVVGKGRKTLSALSCLHP